MTHAERAENIFRAVSDEFPWGTHAVVVGPDDFDILPLSTIGSALTAVPVEGRAIVLFVDDDDNVTACGVDRSTHEIPR